MNCPGTILEQMKQDAIDIFNQGLAAVDPKACILEYCKLDGSFLHIDKQVFDLDRFETILVIGAGKAAASMAAAVEQILQDRITKGLVIVKYDHSEPLKTISIIEAAHPVPDENGVNGSTALLKLAQSADEKTLVLCLISGGGSALMALPAEGLTLLDKQKTTQVLLGCGATIHEINTIRKHLSQIKGGRLARAVYPATMACLVLSDVVGDDLDIISSGPCVADPGTYEQCLKIIDHYHISDHLPGAVMSYLTKGADGLIFETPKPGDPVFNHISHSIVASNFNALLSARKKAQELGYQVLLLSSMIEGETRDVAGVHAAIARQVLTSHHPIKPPACILSGGETTVTIKGKGKGGRNQEFALACGIRIKGLEHIVILSGGTDGTDGPTDAAGAIVDGTTMQRALESGLNPDRHLNENNAYPLFEQLSDLLITGATHTNVMDVRIMLIR
ncbi:MAG: glycerate kinase [Pseudomonadota bacterium]